MTDMQLVLTRSRSLSTNKWTQGVIEVGKDLSLFTIECPWPRIAFTKLMAELRSSKSPSIVIEWGA